jgi:hypothetical protein
MGDVESIPGVDEEVENLGLASSLRQRLLRAEPIGEVSASVPDEPGFSRSLKISSRTKAGTSAESFLTERPAGSDGRMALDIVVVGGLGSYQGSVRAGPSDRRNGDFVDFFWLNHSRARVDRQDAGHHACCSRPRAGGALGVHARRSRGLVQAVELMEGSRRGVAPSPEHEPWSATRARHHRSMEVTRAMAPEALAARCASASVRHRAAERRQWQAVLISTAASIWHPVAGP